MKIQGDDEEGVSLAGAQAMIRFPADVTVSGNSTNGRNASDGGGLAFAGADHTIEITGGSIINNVAGGDVGDARQGPLIQSTHHQLAVPVALESDPLHRRLFEVADSLTHVVYENLEDLSDGVLGAHSTHQLREALDVDEIAVLRNYSVRSAVLGSARVPSVEFRSVHKA